MQQRMGLPMRSQAPAAAPGGMRACRSSNTAVVRAVGSSSSSSKTTERRGFGAMLPKLPQLGGQKGVGKGGVPPAPALDLGAPPEIDALWAQSWAEWLRFGVDEPVRLASSGALVHVVGVGHDQPGSASLICEVVRAVAPDAVAVESPAQYLKAYTSVSRALEPLLDRLLLPPALGPGPGSVAASRGVLDLEERTRWQQLMLAACKGMPLRADEDQLRNLFLVGNVPFAEWLVPALLCRRSKGETLLLACGLDAAARAGLPGQGLFLGREFDLYCEAVQDVLGEEGYGHFQAWQTVLSGRLEAAGHSTDLAALLPMWEAQACVTPEQQRDVVARVLAGMAKGLSGSVAGTGTAAAEVVATAADAAVARRLADMAAGKDVLRPCKRIVAVVGRVHALSVHAALAKLQ